MKNLNDMTREEALGIIEILKDLYNDWVSTIKMAAEGRLEDAKGRYEFGRKIREVYAIFDQRFIDEETGEFWDHPIVDLYVKMTLADLSAHLSTTSQRFAQSELARNDYEFMQEAGIC